MPGFWKQTEKKSMVRHSLVEYVLVLVYIDYINELNDMIVLVLVYIHYINELNDMIFSPQIFKFFSPDGEWACFVLYVRTIMWTFWFPK